MHFNHFRTEIIRDCVYRTCKSPERFSKLFFSFSSFEGLQKKENGQKKKKHFNLLLISDDTNTLIMHPGFSLLFCSCRVTIEHNRKRPNHLASTDPHVLPSQVPYPSQVNSVVSFVAIYLFVSFLHQLHYLLGQNPIYINENIY